MGRRAAGAATDASAPAPQEIASAPRLALDEAGMAHLRQLADLHQAGVLSDDEFADQKARLLA